jgi:hypothetical protein
MYRREEKSNFSRSGTVRKARRAGWTPNHRDPVPFHEAQTIFGMEAGHDDLGGPQVDGTAEK